MVTLPEILFEAGSQVIVPQSVLVFFCEVVNFRDQSNLRVSWFRNDILLEHNVPDILLRNYTGVPLGFMQAPEGVFRLALYVSNFQESLNGVYHCVVEEGNRRVEGKRLNLTGLILLLMLHS